MARFKPSVPFNIPLLLLVPSYTNPYGVPTKAFPDIKDGILFYGSFRTYGGTEREINGVYTVEDTAIVECWFRPDIKSDCRIALPDTGAIYEVLNEPENVNMQNQFLKFKVRRTKGGV